MDVPQQFDLTPSQWHFIVISLTLIAVALLLANPYKSNPEKTVDPGRRSRQA